MIYNILKVISALSVCCLSKTCIQETTKRTGTKLVSTSDVGLLYSDSITSDYKLAKVEVMTTRSGELTGIQLTLSTYSNSGAVRL